MIEWRRIAARNTASVWRSASGNPHWWIGVAVGHHFNVADIAPSEKIAGVFVVTPQIFGDERGQFVETYRKEWIPGAVEMIQGNRADRAEGCLVGLHYHRFQADYWYVPFGRALVLLHDLRQGGPTDGVTEMLEISGDNHIAVYIPPGVAHGFYALTDMTITYLVDGYYNPDDELGVLWNDPELGLDVPNESPILSVRDKSNPLRSEIADELRPNWETVRGGASA